MILKFASLDTFCIAVNCLQNTRDERTLMVDTLVIIPRANVTKASMPKRNFSAARPECRALRGVSRDAIVKVQHKKKNL